MSRIKNEQLNHASSSEEEASLDDFDTDNDLPPSGLSQPYLYNKNPRLSVFRSGLTQGMVTKDVVKELLATTGESYVATAVPCNIQHNTAFIVDTWSLEDMWDIKCDDMGSWTNQGRKNFKKGTLTNDYDMYRQSYTHADLPSLKKYLIYLQNDDVQCRYMFVQYVFTDGETQLTLRPHGNTKQDQRPYKRTMPSTMKAIKDEKAQPGEVMHAVIKTRGGIDNICASGKYPRNRSQIYRARK